MAKALRIAAVVISIAAAIPTGGASLAATIGLSSTAVGAIVTGLTFASALLAKKPSIQGGQTSWRADPDAAIPIILGRTGTSGDIRYRKSHGGSKNPLQTLVTVLSLGPVDGIQQSYIDKEAKNFTGGLTGSYAPWGEARIWQDVQSGLCPEPGVLNAGKGTPPGWTSSHKLSGLCAVMNTFLFDGKGKNTFTQLPGMSWVLNGVKAYDPRKDSTRPGGSGPQRIYDQSTWSWSDNPYVLGLTWCLGWFQGPNNIRVGGVGMPPRGIDIPAFIEGANIADANGWKVGGQVLTSDNKWEILKAILQAGGGEPIRNGAVLSCFVNAPRISLATIGRGDIIGKVTSRTTQTRRDRINGIIPKYRSEDHHWEVVPAGVVRNGVYLAQDGKHRTKEQDYPLVQCAAGDTPDQAAQLAGYDIANAREAGPIVMPLKPIWLGYKAGDCLTIDADLTELGWIAGKDVVILKRQIDPASGAVTLTLRAEDPDKHPWALSRVGVGAPTTGRDVRPDYDEAPTGWTLTAQDNGIRFAGSIVEADDPVLDILFEYAAGISEPDDEDDGAWTGAVTLAAAAAGYFVGGLEDGTTYWGAVTYRYASGRSSRLVLGPVTISLPAPEPNTAFAAAGGVGAVTGSWSNSASPGFAYARLFVGATDDFDLSAQLGGDFTGLPGLTQNFDETLAAGTHYLWTVAYDASDAPSAPTGPIEITIT